MLRAMLLIVLWSGRASCLRSAPLSSRRATLMGAAAATLPLAQRALAFDLPPLDQFEDPKARAARAKMPNPPATAQQAAAFYVCAAASNPGPVACVCLPSLLLCCC